MTWCRRVGLTGAGRDDRGLPLGDDRRSARGGLGDGQRKPNRERAAAAELAGHDDVATHEATEPAAEREAESRAAVAPARGRIGLREVLEEAPELLRGHADAGVGHD